MQQICQILTHSYGLGTNLLFRLYEVYRLAIGGWLLAIPAKVYNPSPKLRSLFQNPALEANYNLL
ncbi:hypothetical protein [Tumidithrix helvetica]|uniref:hypothetical protein n=1 Tax=Tumidithrix helvetica TaxID=3457545 RepID=UPI003CC5DFF4